MAKTWHIKDADPYFYRLGVRRATRGLPFVDEKNPARAYTYSLLFWGAGQSYSGSRMKGNLFQSLMLLFLIAAGVGCVFRNRIAALLPGYGVPLTKALLSLEFLLLCVLVFWVYNAVDAYRTTARARRVPFRGIENKVLPALASLLIPGWGQFMNGQPTKGCVLSVFTVLNLFTVVTIPAVLTCWPFLDPVRSRFLVEAVFAGVLLYVPVIPVIAALSAYDALRVSMDDSKKDTLLDRILLVVTRFRMEGWLKAFRSPVRAVVVIAVLVALGAVLHHHVGFPVSYYSGLLGDVRAWFHQKGMTIVPDLITRVLSGTILAGA